MSDRRLDSGPGNRLALKASINASPEVVFDRLTDCWSQIWDTDQRRVRDGDDPGRPNGLHSVRAIRVFPGVEVVEEIVEHARPHRIAYATVSGAFIADHFAVLELHPTAAGTDIDYQMRVQTRPWVPGWLFARALRGTWRRHSVPTLRWLSEARSS